MSDECSVHRNADVSDGAGRPRFNHGAHLFGAMAAKRNFPMGVHLQVADRCNHACAHCYQIQGLKGELDLAAVCKIIDDLADAGVLTLTVSGGEATLRPDLLDILRHARSRNFAIRLFTNGFTMDGALAAQLRAIGLLEVHVSLYSARAHEHDAVTKVPGSWGKTMAGVRAMREVGLRVVLKTPMVSIAREGASEVKALAASLGCGFSAGTDLTAMEDGSLDPLAVKADAEQLVKAGLLKGWVPPVGDEAERQRAERLGQGSCGVGASGVVVLPNGDVLPCTDTPVVMGNLTETSLAKVLGETDEGALFRRLTLGDVHGCRDCDLVLACKRCHATALHEGGDYLGPYPSACERARSRYALGLGRAVTVIDGEAATERDPHLGPYQIVAEGVLARVPDVITPDDEARARHFQWIRSLRPKTETPLVKLRRKDGTPTGAGRAATTQVGTSTSEKV